MIKIKKEVVFWTRKIKIPGRCSMMIFQNRSVVVQNCLKRNKKNEAGIPVIVNFHNKQSYDQVGRI